MQGVILAAGSAQRLKPLTKDCPKCLLNIGKKNIIERMIKNLSYYNITDFIVVVGFKADMLKTYLQNNLPQFKYTFIHNDDFENNNNAYSLMLTQNEIKDDFILLDSDILFEKEIIKKLIDSDYGCVLAYKKHELEEEEMKIKIDDKDKIIEISKMIPPESAIGESIGIEYFDKAHKELLFSIINKRIKEEERITEFYEASFQEMIDNRIDFYSVDVSDYKCMEIDFIQDIYSAEKNIIPFIDKE